MILNILFGMSFTCLAFSAVVLFVFAEEPIRLTVLDSTEPMTAIISMGYCLLNVGALVWGYDFAKQNQATTAGDQVKPSVRIFIGLAIIAGVNTWLVVNYGFGLLANMYVLDKWSLHAWVLQCAAFASSALCMAIATLSINISRLAKIWLVLHWFLASVVALFGLFIAALWLVYAVPIGGVLLMAAYVGLGGTSLDEADYDLAKKWVSALYLGIAAFVCVFGLVVHWWSPLSWAEMMQYGVCVVIVLTIALVSWALGVQNETTAAAEPM